MTDDTLAPVIYILSSEWEFTIFRSHYLKWTNGTKTYLKACRVHGCDCYMYLSNVFITDFWTKFFGVSPVKWRIYSDLFMCCCYIFIFIHHINFFSNYAIRETHTVDQSQRWLSTTRGFVAACPKCWRCLWSEVAWIGRAANTGAWADWQQTGSPWEQEAWSPRW